MNRQTALIFYVLSVYVVVQFVWWGYHLIELTQEISEESLLVSNRITMVLGEGAVFLLLLMLGLWKIRKSIKKELKVTRGQKNFLLSVTHELKTPLAANKLYIQTVAKRDLSEEKNEELLGKAIEENKRLEKMIDKILNASRLENKSLPLSKEKFNLKTLLLDISARYMSINPTYSIQLEDSRDIELFADKFLIETMLNNLVENAVKYGGNSTIHLSCSRDENFIEIKVKDGGNGIDKELRNDIFEKFFRGGDEDTRTTKGTGLGLYIVAQIAKLHEGSVRYTDNDPQGSTFQILLKHD